MARRRLLDPRKLAPDPERLELVLEQRAHAPIQLRNGDDGGQERKLCGHEDSENAKRSRRTHGNERVGEAEMRRRNRRRPISPHDARESSIHRVQRENAYWRPGPNRSLLDRGKIF